VSLLHWQRQIRLRIHPFPRIVRNRFGRTSRPRAFEAAVREQRLQKLVPLLAVAREAGAGQPAWARNKGASEAEIETARHCLKVQTAQGPS
jgi:hypothetical protein